MRLIFRGVTALAQAFTTAREHGLGCAIAAAPPGGGPCGLALAVRGAELASVLQVLASVGLQPVRGFPPAALQLQK